MFFLTITYIGAMHRKRFISVLWSPKEEQSSKFRGFCEFSLLKPFFDQFDQRLIAGSSLVD